MKRQIIFYSFQESLWTLHAPLLILILSYIMLILKSPFWVTYVSYHNRFGTDRFSRFDVYWITDRQAKYKELEKVSSNNCILCANLNHSIICNIYKTFLNMIVRGKKS